MTARTPDQIAADWAQRLGGSTDKIRAGVSAVTMSPGAAAARQADVWAQNTVNAKAKFQRNSAAVSTQDWQQAMIDKGLNRIGAGATASQAKFSAFMGKLLPYQATLKGQLPARGNLDANIGRMTAWVRGMAQFSNR